MTSALASPPRLTQIDINLLSPCCYWLRKSAALSMESSSAPQASPVTCQSLSSVSAAGSLSPGNSSRTTRGPPTPTLPATGH